jgi:type VI secretion system protein ImpB
MAKEGSVAPKERVNIVYKPATGGAQAEIELPLKLMVLGDFTNREDETALEERKALSVDKDNFNDVMGQQKLGVAINVPNTLTGGEGEELSAKLQFKTLKDFEPAAVARQVPELNKLLDLREALTALKGPLANVPAFRKKIEALLQDPTQREKIMKELGLGEGGAPAPEAAAPPEGGGEPPSPESGA